MPVPSQGYFIVIYHSFVLIGMLSIKTHLPITHVCPWEACGENRTRVSSLENLDNDHYMTHATTFTYSEKYLVSVSNLSSASTNIRNASSAFL